MVDNFDIIRKLLNFDDKSEHFYFVQILQRKKDNREGKVNGTNNNSRLVKAYYIDSLEKFDFLKPEIIELCNIFNARAGINLNRRNYEKMALQHLRKMTDQLLNREFHKAHRAYNKVCGEFSHDSDKTWILDVDETTKINSEYKKFINALQPCEDTDKVITYIPSKSGYHLITKPFNVQEFKKKFPEVDIHKNNPTNLYIP